MFIYKYLYDINLLNLLLNNLKIIFLIIIKKMSYFTFISY